MAGWNTIKRLRNLEERADQLGMRFDAYKHDDRYGENIALLPRDQDALPIYSRDACLFAGTLEEADRFMQGVLWAREYDRMTIDRNLDKKRAQKEENERNLQLVKRLKDEKLNLVKT